MKYSPLIRMCRAIPFLMTALSVWVCAYYWIQSNAPGGNFEGADSMMLAFVGMPLGYVAGVFSLTALLITKQRRFWIPLVVGVLPVACLLVVLIIEFIWFVVGGLIVVGCITLFLRWLIKKGYLKKGEDVKLRTAKVSAPQPVEAPVEQTPVVVEETSEPVAPLIPVVRRRSVCCAWSWILLGVSFPLSFLVGFLGVTFLDISGYEAWAVIGYALFPILLAMLVSIILSIISLCRRENLAWLAAVKLAVYLVIIVGIFSFWAGLIILVITAVVAFRMGLSASKKR